VLVAEHIANKSSMKFNFWISSTVAVFAGLASFGVVLLEMPRIVRVQGYSASQQSAWKAYSLQSAVLSVLPVGEKSLVRKGQVIAELTTERYAQNRNLETAQSELVLAKIKAGHQELRFTDEVAAKTAENISQQINALERELTQGERELQLLGQRLQALEQQSERQQELYSKGFISLEAKENRAAEMLKLQGDLSILQRQRLSVRREIDRQHQELALIDARNSQRKAQLTREISAIEQEHNEFASRKLQLVSPIDGVVAQVSAQVGQTVLPQIPLLTILPSNSGVGVILLLPSKSIGFVREGQKVSVRYQAFPHEHYGRHFGVVKEISKIALPPQEVIQHIKVDEPVYTVHVSLPNDHLTYEGKKLLITPGMVLEADIELDRLKIYQWLLEPLYRLGGRV
jgi:membrane fusion protein